MRTYLLTHGVVMMIGKQHNIVKLKYDKHGEITTNNTFFSKTELNINTKIKFKKKIIKKMTITTLYHCREGFT